MRIAIIAQIKGLSIQTQQKTFVLFTVFKLTSDERKTLTKISMCKPLTAIPNEERDVCIIDGESEALGFHQETMEESRIHQDWFCIKLYIISYQTSFILAVWF